MSTTGADLQRVHYVNANWAASDENGQFSLLVVTEDGRRHELAVSAEAAGPLIELTQASNALIWDGDNETLIAANLVGQWVQDTTTPTPPSGLHVDDELEPGSVA